jgi:hypothetical protein
MHGENTQGTFCINQHKHAHKEKIANNAGQKLLCSSDCGTNWRDLLLQRQVQVNVS